MSQMNEFQLLTSFVLPAELLHQTDHQSVNSTLQLAIPTLDLHLTRLVKAHQAMAQAIPTSWCAQESPINPALILNTLITKINSLREQSLNKQSLRARLTIGPSHTISFTTSPMPSLPPITLLISLDNQPTSYHQDPFLLTKTTQRKYYDDTRARHGK